MISSSDLIFLFFTVGLIAFLLVVRIIVVKVHRRAWSALGESTGLAFTPGNFFGRGMSLSGEYRSYPLTLEFFNFRSGRTSSTYTHILLPLRAGRDLSFWLTSETVFSKIAKAAGKNDFQTGDDALDRRFTIRGNPQAGVARLLSSPGLRQMLLDAPSLQVRLEEGQIDLLKQGVLTNPTTLVYLLDLAVALAAAVESARG
ncbi:MAG TPA: hypothetical protein VMT46_10175 [Anaerolineaceae bacterium]|nr:hypothetical protein [Anaerolineaceae bacterium]